MEENTNSIRTVPFSLEAEQSVLGAMFLDKDCIPDAIEILKGDDFYIGRNKELFLTRKDTGCNGKIIQ